MERLSGLDASFLYLETPQRHMHVVMSTTLDPATVPGGYTFAKVRRLIADRIPLLPVFQRRLVEVPFRLSHPIWVDDPDFDIDFHVRPAAVPRPGASGSSPTRSGTSPAARSTATAPVGDVGRGGAGRRPHRPCREGPPLHGGRRLRRRAAVGPLRPGARPRPRRDPGPGAPRDTRIPNPVELMAQALVARTLRPIEMTHDLVRTGQRVLDVRRVRQEPEHRPPRQGRPAPVGPPHLVQRLPHPAPQVALAAIGLEDVKRVKAARAPRSTTWSWPCAPGRSARSSWRATSCRTSPLVAVVPVSVGPTSTTRRAPTRCRRCSYSCPPSWTTPSTGCDAIHEGTLGAKEEHEALGADTLINWAEHATPNFFANAARLYSRMRLADRHRPIANLVISNVPGPDFPLYLGGAELGPGSPWARSWTAWGSTSPS